MIRILIVDDESLIRLGVKTSLLAHADVVQVVGEENNGARALEWIKNHPDGIDCVLTDIKMPIMDGIELTKSIRAQYPQIKVMILSSYNDIEYVKNAILCGASDYLLKYEVDEDNILEKFEALFGSLHVGREGKIPEKSRCARNDVVRKTFEGELGEKAFDDKKKKVVLVMEVIDYEKVVERNYAQDKGSLLEMALINILTEYLGNKNEMEIVAEGEGKYSIVYQIQEKEHYSNTLEFAGMLMKKYLNLCVRIAVSGVVLKWSEIYEAYGQAKSILPGDFFRRKDQNYFVEYRKVADSDLQQAVILLRETCGRILEKRDFVALNDFFDKAEDTLFEYRCVGEEAVKKGCRMLARTVFSGLGRLSEQECERMEHKIMQEATLFETMRLLKRETESILNQEEKYQQDVSAVIKKAIDFVWQNYADDQLSLSKTAEYLHLNPSYFSRLFKKETGKGFTDYLIGIRIEQAGRLIGGADGLSLQEVSRMAGFANYNHFSKTFKKVTGKLPSEFKL